MITEQDLLAAIAECEGERNPTANTCYKLASFYTILNHLHEKDGSEMRTAKVENPISYSFDAGTVTYSSDTEFGHMINGKGEAFAWKVMDELMTTLQEMIPKLYTGVMHRLNE